jgi:cellulose synthase/poly-beta-1,6-N-acetylglucosamine synthase-like glycosyltransferase
MLFPVFLLIFLVFVNRYFAGRFWGVLHGDRTPPSAEKPTVSVVVPMYNEGRRIFETIVSLHEQDYPADRFEIVVVDDCSTDDSYEWACRAATGRENVRVLRNPQNMGKRRGINHAVRASTAEIIVSVDSDVVVEKDAIGKLVERFVRPEIAAVGGRVQVLNARENWLTSMQAVKYFFGYEYLKNLERAFNSVMCLSGCLTAYRRHVLVTLEPVLENRSWLGMPIKYGEDRFLTRQIVKAGHQTVLTLDAICWTVVPNTLSKYFAQQIRWRRSNIIDFFAGLGHAWRLHPVVALHWLSLFTVLLSYPVILMDNLVSGAFWELTLFHLGVLILLSAVYWFDTRSWPEERKVHPLWFVAAAVVMPVTYVLFTPLALFTLDSSSWETRGATQLAQPTQPPPTQSPPTQPPPDPTTVAQLESALPHPPAKYLH